MSIDQESVLVVILVQELRVLVQLSQITHSQQLDQEQILKLRVLSRLSIEQRAYQLQLIFIIQEQSL